MADLFYIKVTEKDADIRLDRWFQRHYPTISQSLLQKHLRKGFIRVDDKKATAGQHLEIDQKVRIHPIVFDEAKSISALAPMDIRPKKALFSEEEIAALHNTILYKDDNVIAINKPAGLAVQGGSGIKRSLDDALEYFRFESDERPKLVHRLDKDTSGVLLLARHAKAATELTQYFKHKSVRKIYWAILVGVPQPLEGKINVPLQKVTNDAGLEKVSPEADDGQFALTYYKVVDSAAKTLSWVAFMPVTGRTHQLRVHALALGCPILGDGKYGGKKAFIEGLGGFLHLHARELILPNFYGKKIHIKAELDEAMQRTWDTFGFEKASGQFASNALLSNE